MVGRGPRVPVYVCIRMYVCMYVCMDGWMDGCKCMDVLVVNSGAFFFFASQSHHKYKKKSFSGEVKESVNFPLFFFTS